MQKCLIQRDKEEISEAAVSDMVFLHVFAPAMVSYVEWVLAEAAASGKKRLYFLARDGWMMYQAAQILADFRHAGTELKYLRVSRYSLRRAEYHLLKEKCLDSICTGGIDVTFEKLMKRAALTEEEGRRVAELAGYADRYQQPLNYRQLHKLSARLGKLKPFLEYIQVHSAVCYEDTVGYLRQEGLMDEIPYAFVDSGWIGTLQMSLQHLIADACKVDRKMEGYYFGIYEIPKSADRNQYHGFFFTPAKGIFTKIGFSNCLFEAVFSAPEGMTMGYAYADGRYVPVESQIKNPNAEALLRHAGLLREYLHAYTHRAYRNTCPCGPGGLGFARAKGGRAVAKKLLLKMMGTPTAAEARVFGSRKFCDDILELTMQPVAVKWTDGELRKQRFFNKLLSKSGLREGGLKESAWPEGSITMAQGNVRKNLRQERFYKFLMYIRKAIVKK